MAATASSSASGSSSKPLKRRVDSHELDFFTPAATSFKPRPYTPHSRPSPIPLQTSTLPSTLRNYTKSYELHSTPPPGMDPLPTDSSAVFIHPPFTDFPSSTLYPDGLTYQLMADNPEWFLVADDFVSPNNRNSNAISYPPHLEPPRGWCPAKKRDLKDRGEEGWPEGEEPRLRCTFCRRTYAGVNAKSMWRRHVFEKHKIAMANRRDNNIDRPRGRGANKENKLPSGNESHDSLLKMEVAPQTDFRSSPMRSKFRSLLPAAEEIRRRKTNKESAYAYASNAEPHPPQNGKEPNPLSQSHVSPPSPPLTPPLSSNPDVSPDSDSNATTSPPLAIPTIPPSPYDPLLTPSFRHSPPRLPSDQPWRFPSPSHPLHSRCRELSLSMLIRDLNSPLVKGSPAMVTSPSFVQASPVPSPRAPPRPKRAFLESDTPESLEKLSRPSPRFLFSRGSHCNTNRNTRYIQDSPLQRVPKATAQRHQRADSDVSDDWLSEVSLTSNVISTSSSELLPTADPFNIMYPSWVSISDSSHGSPGQHRVVTATTGADSPVLRNGTLPTGVGLGIGLLGPFTLLEGDACQDVNDSDFEGLLLNTPDDQMDKVVALDIIAADDNGGCERTPPLKKRRMTIED